MRLFVAVAIIRFWRIFGELFHDELSKVLLESRQPQTVDGQQGGHNNNDQ